MCPKSKIFHFSLMCFYLFSYITQLLHNSKGPQVMEAGAVTKLPQRWRSHHNTKLSMLSDYMYNPLTKNTGTSQDIQTLTLRKKGLVAFQCISAWQDWWRMTMPLQSQTADAIQVIRILQSWKSSLTHTIRPCWFRDLYREGCWMAQSRGFLRCKP